VGKAKVCASARCREAVEFYDTYSIALSPFYNAKTLAFLSGVTRGQIAARLNFSQVSMRRVLAWLAEGYSFYLTSFPLPYILFCRTWRIRL
jgi:hypothetical protein